MFIECGVKIDLVMECWDFYFRIDFKEILIFGYLYFDMMSNCVDSDGFGLLYCFDSLILFVWSVI